MESSKGTQTPTDEEVRYVSVTKTLNLRVNSFENIDDVKENFSKLKVIETNLEKFFFTDGAFDNDHELYFQRKDGSSIYVNLHLGVEMQIRVESRWNAKITSLDVHCWDTISDVKTMFEDKDGTPVNQLTLFYHGKQLDDLQTLVSYDIENDSIIYAILLGEDKIKIRLLRRPPGSWNPIEVMVKLCSTVENLKRMIHCMVGFPIKKQNLTFDGVLLENSMRLADYKIQMGSEIYLDSSKGATKIFVKTLKEKVLTIYVDITDTILSLKTVIKYIEGIPEREQQLMFKTYCLPNSFRLGQLGIENESTLHLIPCD